MPEIIFSIVDLPAPFGPSSATMSPSSAVIETPWTARNVLS
jgi:hypothetical protein